MRRLLHAIAVLGMVFSAVPSSAQTAAPAPSADALAAAREVIVTMHAVDQLKTMFPLMMQNLKPVVVQNRPEVEKDFNSLLPMMLEIVNSRVGEFVDAMATVYANTFTAAELRDLAAFYKTVTGQKIVEKMPMLAQQSMMAGQAWGRSMAADLQAKMVNELRKRGHNI
jgi:hypothetical protein